MLSEIRAILDEAGVADRLHASDGDLDGADLADAYAAMDVLAFCSHSDTQGMVLAEAMAAGAPVVALDAPGARDIVRDRQNGRLVAAEREVDFANALKWVQARRNDPQLRAAVARTAAEFSMDRTVEQLICVYRKACRESGPGAEGGVSRAALQRRLNEALLIWRRIGRALSDAALGARRSDENSRVDRMRRPS
jgi:glycosyltransferase involved in cell wall biosynthesis